MGVQTSRGRWSGVPWWVWVLAVLCVLMVVVYLVWDALAGTHGV